MALVEGANHIVRCVNRFLRQEDSHTLFEAVLDAAIAILGADKGFLQQLDPASGRLVITVQRGFDSAFVEFFSQIGVGTVACGTAVLTKQNVIVDDDG